MKRIIVIISLLWLMLGMTSCVNEEKKAFQNFVSSERMSCDVFILISGQGNSIKEEILDFTIWEDGIEIYMSSIKMSIIVDVVNDVMLYTNYNNKDFLGTKIENNNNEEKKHDLSECFSAVDYGEGEVTFEIDMDTYVKEYLPDMITEKIGKVKVVSYVEDTTINKVEIQFNELEIFQELVNLIGLSDFTLSLENIKYNDEVRIPKYDIRLYDIYNNELFLEFFKNSLLGKTPSDNPIEPENPAPQKEYYHQMEKEYLVGLNGELVLSGEIYWTEGYNNKNCYISECEVTYSPELDLSTLGKKDYLVTVKYDTYTFTEKINVNVVDLKKYDQKISLDTIKIVDIFTCNGYLLLADDKKIYKFDLEQKEIVGSVNLKCLANSIYLKDDYLYVSATYPNVSTLLEEDGYDGTISKIKFSDFTLAYQMQVDCAPYSIIVDNRDNVIVSKLHNQSIYYAIIDLEQRTFEDLMWGYEEDYLIYNSDKDAFLCITQKVSSNNYWVYYGENGYMVNDYKSSSLGIDKVTYVSQDGKVIILNVYGKFVYCEYDSDIKDYVCYKVSNDTNLPIYSTSIDDGLVYLFGYEQNIPKLLTYNPNNSEMNSIYLKNEDIVINSLVYNGMFISFGEENIYFYNLD